MFRDRPVLLVITGLQQEAAIAAGDGVATLCSGGNVEALAALLARQAAPAVGVLSFGLGGGLAPHLQSGDVVIASRIVSEAGPHETDPSWHQASLAALRGIRAYPGAIAGCDAVLVTPQDKARVHAQTSALVVDMESHLAADYAARHGLPFLAIRAVSDPAHRSLPAIASDALRVDGSVDVPKVIRGILRRPGQLPALISAGTDSRKAFAALRRCRGLLGPLFGLRSANL